jgi:hypothetical protein
VTEHGGAARRSWTGYPVLYNGDIVVHGEWVGLDDGNLESVEEKGCVRVLSLIIYDGIGLECFPKAVRCLGLVNVTPDVFHFTIHPIITQILI